MRKANKAMIAAEIIRYAEWRSEINERLAKIDKRGAKIITSWADNARKSIAGGDHGPCTRALIRSVVRAIEDFESGFYVGTTKDGGFLVKPADETKFAPSAEVECVSKAAGEPCS